MNDHKLKDIVERRLKRRLGLIFLAVLLLALFFSPVNLALAAHSQSFPEEIPLPNGFQPEGIAVGRGTCFYVGSIPTGDIYHGSLRTGEGEILVSAPEGRHAIGLAVDERTNYLYVAGGPTGEAYVYDARTGAPVADFQLTDSSSTFVNDVVVTQDAAYFTDSFRPYMYRMPLSKQCELPDTSAIEEIELTGDFQFVDTPGAFNANGIDAAPNGKQLVIVNSATGSLYWVDPDTGEAVLIDLAGGSVLNGDGILLDGKTLYVVQNQNNQIAVVELEPSDLTSGEIVTTITNADFPNEKFQVPTTIAEFGSRLYVVNARLGVTDPEAEYNVVQVQKPH